ncbi:MAG: hypothetical protein ACPG31_04695 [Planctomycetota bacterium]
MKELPLHIEGWELQGLELQTKSGWNRRTTVVALRGKGCVGYGEDVTYAGEEQAAFQERGLPVCLEGDYTLQSFAAALDAIAEEDWFPNPPEQPASLHFRRWAFESAALDLALKQNAVSLADFLGRSAAPVHFVHSVGLGNPPSLDILHQRLFHVPDLRFKLDWDESWEEEFLYALRDLDAVDVVDFKGHYHGAFEGPDPEPTGYAIVAEMLPHAWLEDPAWTKDCADVLMPHVARVTWDAPLHHLSDLEALPVLPKRINIKPSRFATVARLLRVLEWMQQQGVAGYGGGQFELGPGRKQIQHLASLCYAEAANDVAPVEYHAGEWEAAPPASPLPAFGDVVGFGGWEPE